MPVFFKFELDEADVTIVTFVKGGLIGTGIKMLSSVLSNEALLGPLIEKKKEYFNSPF